MRSSQRRPSITVEGYEIPVGRTETEAYVAHAAINQQARPSPPVQGRGSMRRASGAGMYMGRNSGYAVQAPRMVPTPSGFGRSSQMGLAVAEHNARRPSGMSSSGELPQAQRRQSRVVTTLSEAADKKAQNQLLEAEENFLPSEAVPLTDGLVFISLVTVEVFLNMLILGVEVDAMCTHNCKEDSNAIWFYADVTFAGLAFIDWVLAVAILGPGVYFRGEEIAHSQFNVFRCTDTVFVWSRIFDAALAAIGFRSGLKYISICRIMHLGRLARELQSSFRELWLIAQGLKETLKCLGFVFSVMVLILWVFGTMITILKGKEPNEKFSYPEPGWNKDDYWGTVPRSMLSLFQVFTRDSWGERVARHLIIEDWTICFFFIIFLTLTVLSLSSTIVGVIVESTLTSAKANVEKKGLERAKFEGLVMRSLEQIFRDADTDESGDLTQFELHKALERVDVRNRMKLVGISLVDLDLLFTLLDEEGEGQGAIRINQFFKGCARLRGPAMAKDTCHMNIDLDRYTKRCERMDDNMQKANDSIAEVLDLLDYIDREVFSMEQDQHDPVLQARRQRVQASKANYLRRKGKDLPSEEEPPPTAAARVDRDVLRPPDFGTDMMAPYRSRPGQMRPQPQGTKIEPPWSTPPRPPPLPPHLMNGRRAQSA